MCPPRCSSVRTSRHRASEGKTSSTSRGCASYTSGICGRRRSWVLPSARGGCPRPSKSRVTKPSSPPPPTVSALQSDVVSVLEAIGLRPDCEVLTKRGYRLDAIVEVHGKTIGIEVDGPSHFAGRRLTGNAALKRRQVTGLDGIPLVSVPYWEWNALKSDRDKKQHYLSALLGLHR